MISFYSPQHDPISYEAKLRQCLFASFRIIPLGDFWGVSDVSAYIDTQLTRIQNFLVED